MTIRIRIAKFFRKVLNVIVSAFLHFCRFIWAAIVDAALSLFCFVCDLIIEAVALKWYYWLALILPFIRVYKLSFGNDIVPAFAKDGYTYQALWYYTWSRVLELILYFIISEKTKSLLFLTGVILSIGALMDEAVYPFDFYIGTYCYWLAAAAMIFRKWYIDQWKQ